MWGAKSPTCHFFVLLHANPVRAANETGLHYDRDLLCLILTHMEDNQPRWDLCQPECEMSHARALLHTHIVTHTHLELQSHSEQWRWDRKWTWKQMEIGLSARTSARSQRQMVNQWDLLLSLHTPCVTLPVNQHPGTQGRWHVANVTVSPENYLFIHSINKHAADMQQMKAVLFISPSSARCISF